MRDDDDLSVALRSWLSSAATPTAPAELFDAVVAESFRLAPRGSWRAVLHGNQARFAPIARASRIAVLAATVVVLLIGLIIAVLLGAERSSPPIKFNGQVQASASVVPPSGPIVVEIPTGVTPVLAIEQVERRVRDAMAQSAAGLAPDPVVIRRLTFVPAGQSYPFGSPDASGQQPGSIGVDEPTWFAEVDGTGTICSSFCDASDRVIVRTNDSTDPVSLAAAVTGYRDPDRVYTVPAPEFRATLAKHGLAYAPSDPSTAVGDPSMALARLTAAQRTTMRNGPVYGLVSIANADLAARNPLLGVTPTPGQSRGVWWLQLTDAPWTWIVVDASTGALLGSGASIS
jgi:hypothetical protein